MFKRAIRKRSNRLLTQRANESIRLIIDRLNDDSCGLRFELTLRWAVEIATQLIDCQPIGFNRRKQDGGRDSAPCLSLLPLLLFLLPPPSCLPNGEFCAKHFDCWRRLCWGFV